MVKRCFFIAEHVVEQQICGKYTGYHSVIARDFKPSREDKYFPDGSERRFFIVKFIYLD